MQFEYTSHCLFPNSISISIKHCSKVINMSIHCFPKFGLAFTRTYSTFGTTTKNVVVNVLTTVFYHCTIICIFCTSDTSLSGTFFANPYAGITLLVIVILLLILLITSVVICTVFIGRNRCVGIVFETYATINLGLYFHKFRGSLLRQQKN